MRNSRVLGRQLLRMGSCKSTQTLSPTSIAAELPSPPPNLDFLQHRSRIKGFSSSASEYPDWKWNKFWSMHVPWEDRRLFVVPPEIYLYKKDEYDLELKRVQDKYLSAIFCFYEYDAQTHDYFFIHSVISRWAKEFPHVALYQIIIDHRYIEDLNNVIKEYNINCTPTFRFFQNGKRVHDVAGGSTVLLEKTLKKNLWGSEADEGNKGCSESERRRERTVEGLSWSRGFRGLPLRPASEVVCESES